MKFLQRSQLIAKSSTGEVVNHKNKWGMWGGAGGGRYRGNTVVCQISFSPARTSNQKRFISSPFSGACGALSPVIPNIFPNGNGLRWVNKPLKFTERCQGAFLVFLFFSFFSKSRLKQRSQHLFIGEKLPVSNTFHFPSRFPVSRRQRSL